MTQIRLPAMCALFALLAPSLAYPAPRGAEEARKLTLALVSVTAKDAYQNPEHAIDGDPNTEFTFVWGNGGAKLLFELGEPSVVERVEVTAGPGPCPFFLAEVDVGPDLDNMRGLLSRPINLVTKPLQKTIVTVTPSVGKFIRVDVRAGAKVGVGEIEVLGRRHRPERHLCHWWSMDPTADFLDAMDYLDRDLGATDVWIDKVATALPST